MTEETTTALPPIHERCVEHKATTDRALMWSSDRDRLWVALEGKVGFKVFFATMSLMVALLVAILGWSVQTTFNTERRVEESRIERLQQLDELKRTLNVMQLDQRETQVLLREFIKASASIHENR